ncbi:tRNA-intron lyase [Candidatus Hecatella orcuttiae]|jgi:tRNA-intron endonuclease|uniref:tRNA-intron lyase n=1 Tax=Candidatus Hecatella orcuttiae TaxID=1935119 RepID=UPI0028683107|nr:tRNA-intron lyase [Candidatus Hecatella orcuttiae]
MEAEEGRAEKEAAAEKRPVEGFVKGEKVYVSLKDPEAARLVSRGFGEETRGRLELASWEALYLVAEGELRVVEKDSGVAMSFEELLSFFSQKDRRVWSKYLVYRDLRSRGYTVKKGFGHGSHFRVYERGAYGKEPAKFLISTMLEGEPLPVQELVKTLSSARSLKKEAILGVIERRGEVVYYTLSQFNP